MKSIWLIIVIAIVISFAAIVTMNFISMQTESELKRSDYEKKQTMHERQIQEIKNAILAEDFERASNALQYVELNDEEYREIMTLVNQAAIEKLDRLILSAERLSVSECSPAQINMINELEKKIEQADTAEMVIVYANQINQIRMTCR